MALKLYTSVAKELKLKVTKFLVLIPMSVEVTGENPVGFLPPPPPRPPSPLAPAILNKVKMFAELLLAILLME